LQKEGGETVYNRLARVLQTEEVKCIVVSYMFY